MPSTNKLQTKILKISRKEKKIKNLCVKANVFKLCFPHFLLSLSIFKTLRNKTTVKKHVDHVIPLIFF